MVSGGFPCQNISAAGKGEGIYGQKSSLWFDMLRVIREIRPKYVFVENTPMLVSRGLDTVLSGLSEVGYDAEWLVLSASSIGAPHIRERLWILAKNESASANPQSVRRCVPLATLQKKLAQHQIRWRKGYNHLLPALPTWESGNTGIQSLGDGFPFAVEQLTAIGNAQVPVCAATAFSVLYSRIDNESRI